MCGRAFQLKLEAPLSIVNNKYLIRNTVAWVKIIELQKRRFPYFHCFSLDRQVQQILNNPHNAYKVISIEIPGQRSPQFHETILKYNVPTPGGDVNPDAMCIKKADVHQMIEGTRTRVLWTTAVTISKATLKTLQILLMAPSKIYACFRNVLDCESSFMTSLNAVSHVIVMFIACAWARSVTSKSSKLDQSTVIKRARQVLQMSYWIRLLTSKKCSGMIMEEGLVYRWGDCSTGKVQKQLDLSWNKADWAWNCFYAVLHKRFSKTFREETGLNESYYYVSLLQSILERGEVVKRRTVIARGRQVQFHTNKRWIISYNSSYSKSLSSHINVKLCVSRLCRRKFLSR